jgi:DNA-binding IclR family transcriptional regulator
MIRSGTQSLERAALLLRELAARGTLGWRLSDLARRCGLDKGTAHRMVACLVRERLARQRAADRRYVPGPLLFELSLALPAYPAFQASVQPHLDAAARKLRAHAFLCIRSGADFVCAANAGAPSTRGLTHEVGLRRPLAVSAGGAAILVALPGDEAARLVADNLRRIEAAGEVRLRAVDRMLRRSRAHGFGIHLGDIVPRVNTYGVAIAQGGAPLASISLAGRAEDLPTSRLPEIRAALDDAAQRISAEAARLLA